MALGSGQWMRVHTAAHPPGVLPRSGIVQLLPQCPASPSGTPAWISMHLMLILSTFSWQVQADHAALLTASELDATMCMPCKADYLSRGEENAVAPMQCTETEATNAYVELGLRAAMRSITPRSKGNKHFLADIQNNLDLLKQHLVY